MFEWDEEKRKLTIKKHGIDFRRIARIFALPHIVLEGNSPDEDRWLAVGESQGKVFAVVYTKRGETIRIITARRARRNEREEYQAFLSRRNSRDG